MIAIAVESLGATNENGSIFLREIGKRLTSISGDPRKTSFPLQRISVKQPFNVTMPLPSGAVFRKVPDSQTEVSMEVWFYWALCC